MFCVQGSESPPRQRGLDHIFAMLSAQQMAAAGAAGEGQHGEGQQGQDAQQHDAVQAGQTLPSMDALEEGATSLTSLLQVCIDASLRELYLHPFQSQKYSMRANSLEYEFILALCRASGKRSGCQKKGQTSTLCAI